MRRSKTEIYLHIVWATRQREPLLVDDLPEVVRQAVFAEARLLDCSVLAFGGIPDHRHLLARVPGRIAAAQLAKQVKGVSAREANRALPNGEGFRWQEGYGAFSVSRSHIKRVVAYIEDQPRRHAAGDIWPEWEETDEEGDETPATPGLPDDSEK